MLAIPLKRPSPAALNSGFEQFLKKLYDDTEVSKFSGDISAIQQLRNAACVVGTASDQSQIQHLYRYNYHLKTLVPKLSGYNPPFRVQLVWTEAFRPNKNFQSGSLLFEWASILWNLAAIESYKGAMGNRSTDEGIRVASLNFQQAGGIFEFIRKEILPKMAGEQNTPEFTDECLILCRQLMLAQAQTCFYEKSVKEKKAGTMKASIVCKLASQIVAFYNSALECARHRLVSGVVDVSWVHHMEFQRDSFKGLAEYWQAVAHHDDATSSGFGYGSEICRLRKAERIISNVLQYGKNNKIPASLIAATDNVYTVVQRARMNAEKDNDGVYHELIPSESSLTEVPPIPMVRCSDMPEYYNNEKPFFSDLVPKEVKVLVTKYQESTENILRDCSGTASKATNEGRAALSELGLPGSLELFKSGGMLPENLWVKIQRIQSLGGISELNAKYSNLESASARARLTMEAIENSLLRESSQMDAFRQRHASVVTPDISRLQQDIRQNLTLLRDAHRDASLRNQAIQNELSDETFVSYMRSLFQSKAEISNMLPKADNTSNAFINTAKLEEKLIQFANLFESRDRLLQQLQETSKRDVTSNMVATLASMTPPYADDNLSRAVQNQISADFGSSIDAIHLTIAQQNDLFEEVKSENSLFVNSRINDPVTLERDLVIKHLEQGMSSYFSLNSKIAAGNTFFMNLQTRLTGLVQQCDDMCYTQQLYRQDLEMDMCLKMQKASQEEQDHIFALKMSEELSAVQINQQTSAPPSQMAPAPSYQGNQHQHQQQMSQNNPQSQYQQQLNGTAYPQPPLQPSNTPYYAQQLPPQPSASSQQSISANGYVAYGQPIAGPPSAGINQYMSPSQPTSFSSNVAVNDKSYPYNPNVEYPGHTANHYGGVQGHSSAPPSAPPSSIRVPITQAPPQQYSAPPTYIPIHTDYMGNSANNPPSYQQTQYSNNSNNNISNSYAQGPANSYQPAAPPNPPSYGSYPNLSYPVSNPTMSDPREQKIGRLVEMGFTRDAVLQSLHSNNDNEEAALNSLLSPPVQDSQPPSSNVPSNQNSGGIFGKMWGR